MTDDSANALPPGTRLGEFELKRVLGVGGFGIVYLAFDHDLEREVAVKEYMPISMAGRTSSQQVLVHSLVDRENFTLGLRSFVNEARLLARFDHPALVKVYRYWEANGTAYMAMPFYVGRSLHQVRAAMTAPPDEAWLRGLLMPLLGALDRLHGQEVYHRDIAPDNVLLLDDGAPVLLDFGAARRVLSDRSMALTAILKPSYAPIEQYGEAGPVKQGPWTDLYALGATLHYLLRGRPPPPATSRMLHDEYRPLVGSGLPACSDAFLACIDWMLRPRPGERPAHIASLRAMLEGRAPIPLAGSAPQMQLGTTDIERTVIDLGQSQPAATEPTRRLEPAQPVPATVQVEADQRVEPAFDLELPDAVPAGDAPAPAPHPVTPDSAPSRGLAADADERERPTPAGPAGPRRWGVPALAALVGVAALAGWLTMRGRADEPVVAQPPLPASAAAAAGPASQAVGAPAPADTASAATAASTSSDTAASTPAAKPAALPATLPAAVASAGTVTPAVATTKPAAAGPAAALKTSPAPRAGASKAEAAKAEAARTAAAEPAPRPAPQLPPPLVETRPAAPGGGMATSITRLPPAPEPQVERPAAATASPPPAATVRPAATPPANTPTTAAGQVSPAAAAATAPPRAAPVAVTTPAPTASAARPPAPAASVARSPAPAAREAVQLRARPLSPSERCEGRVLLALSSCIEQQCRSVPELAQHPECARASR